MSEPILPKERPIPAHTASEVLELADIMAPEELDHLPYGMIQLDRTGRILKYNAVESRLASLRQEDAIGKQFLYYGSGCCSECADKQGRKYKFAIIELHAVQCRYSAVACTKHTLWISHFINGDQQYGGYYSNHEIRISS